MNPAEATRRPPDRVLIDRAAFWCKSPQHGDLVAIQTERGGLQVKRIIAVPGDEVALRQSGLRINGRHVDSILPPDQIPSIAIFDTAYPDQIGPRWRIADDGHWNVYHHRSIHDVNRPAPIRDDYPANTAVSRQLVPVMHKQLSGRIAAAEPVRVDVEIWLLDRRERFRGRFPAGKFAWSVSSLAAEGISEMMQPTDHWQRIELGSSEEFRESPVSAEMPIAVRVFKADAEELATGARLSDLVISRHFRWYVRRRDQRAWPATSLRLQPGRYFVVGDNLPVSVDSRADPQGIERSRIVGRVLRSFSELRFP